MLQEEKQGLPPQEKLVIKAATVPQSKIIDGVAFYIIKVTGSFNSWCVSKRYSQFEQLQGSICDAKGFPSSLDLPPKRYKFFGSQLSPAFLEERRVLLEAYLKKLVSIEDVAKNQTFTSFLTSDKTDNIDVKAKSDRKRPIDDIPDDVEVTGVTIPATRQMSDHVLYQIDVVNSRKEKEFSKWTVLKRFGQFYEMDAAVRLDLAEKIDVTTLPATPERKFKLFNDHSDVNFVEQRRVLLENYLQRMSEVDDVVRNKYFLAFLGIQEEK
jgi:hypothetical protein